MVYVQGWKRWGCSTKRLYILFYTLMLKVVYKDDSVRVPNFSLQQILPDTEDYITYEVHF